MTDLLNRLIDALREELQQYGEMLALLDQQQEYVLLRAPNDLLQSVAAVHAQGLRLQAARQQREAHRRELARLLTLPDDSGFAHLLPRVPEDYRPLLSALVQENNELLARVQQRARQNHLLLSRSLELMQRFISSLFSAGQCATYNGVGALTSAPLPVRSLYEAVV